MKDYFQGVDFSELPEPKPKALAAPRPKKKTAQPTTDEIFRREIDEYHRVVMQMLEAVRSGESEFCKPTVLSGPLLSAIAHMHAKPDTEAVRDFLVLTATDLNRRMAQEFEKLLSAEYTFAQNEEKVGNLQFPTLKGMYLGG